MGVGGVWRGVRCLRHVALDRKHINSESSADVTPTADQTAERTASDEPKPIGIASSSSLRPRIGLEVGFQGGPSDRPCAVTGYCMIVVVGLGNLATGGGELRPWTANRFRIGLIREIGRNEQK